MAELFLAEAEKVDSAAPACLKKWIMHCLKNTRLTFGFFIAAVFLTVSSCTGQIRYFRQPTVPLEHIETRSFLAASQDSIANDTLFQMVSAEGYPVAYFRKIRTSVCFDNKCRLLKCVLFWNVTGRYLGFELPKGEFLSKAEHKAFTPQEYQRLSALLADQSSPLRVLSYSELAPQLKATGDDVDGVSSATAKNVLDYVVEGAAYTTYKMWHVVYGATQEDIERLTETELTAKFAIKMMQSPDLNDRIWVLSHIKGHIDITPELRTLLFECISDANYSLAERAINVFGPQDMMADTVQLLLIDKFNETGYSLKKQIIAKFKEVPQLNPSVCEALLEKLSLTNSELVSNVLDVLAMHKASDITVARAVAELLSNSNQFIAQKAFLFLGRTEITDPTIAKKLAEYRAK
jgi:hypothetical protein